MPYIKQEDRDKLDKYIDILDEELTRDNHYNLDEINVGAGGLEYYLAANSKIANRKKGHYNYVITKLMHLYIKHYGLNYDNCSNVNGILNDVIVEFNRKVVAKYEDKKAKENGDIGVL